MLRIAFAGTPQFALPTLQALAASAHRLVGVLTQPDRPAGRGRQLHDSPVKRLALQLGVPVSQPEQLAGEEQRAALVSWQPELLVVVAYGLLLPAAVLTLPRLGCLNVHASLLPRWRGAAPIQHAILAGDAHTGVSIMSMDRGLDTGPILASERVAIGAATNAAQLHERLAQQGAALLIATLAALQSGRAQPRAQPAEGVTYAPKLDKRLAQIDWGLAAAQLDRQVRAFNPWPVAQTTWYGTQLRIWEAQVADESRVARALESLPATVPAVPGTVLGLDEEHLLVMCGQGALALGKLQLAGRRIVAAREFASAADPVGARLGA